MEGEQRVLQEVSGEYWSGERGGKSNSYTMKRIHWKLEDDVTQIPAGDHH